jgi:hypothetical protein
MAKEFWQNNRIHSRDKLHKLKKETVRSTTAGIPGEQKLGKSILQDYCKDMRKKYRSEIGSSSCWKGWLKIQKEAKAADGSRNVSGPEHATLASDDEDTGSTKLPVSTTGVVVDFTMDYFVLPEVDFQRY